jgi:hypothetical protein
MTSSPKPLPEKVEDTVLAEIIGCFSSGETFFKSESFREQCAHAYRILHRMHTPPVPFAAIAQLFSVDRGAKHKHSQDFKAQEIVLRMWQRLPVLTIYGFSEIVDMILDGQITGRP